MSNPDWNCPLFVLIIRFFHLCTNLSINWCKSLFFQLFIKWNTSRLFGKTVHLSKALHLQESCHQPSISSSIHDHLLHEQLRSTYLQNWYPSFFLVVSLHHRECSKFINRLQNHKNNCCAVIYKYFDEANKEKEPVIKQYKPNKKDSVLESFFRVFFGS